MKKSKKTWLYIFAILMFSLTTYITIFPIIHIGWDKMVEDGRIWLVFTLALCGYIGAYCYYWVARYGTGMAEYHDKNKGSLK